MLQKMQHSSQKELLSKMHDPIKGELDDPFTHSKIPIKEDSETIPMDVVVLDMAIVQDFDSVSKLLEEYEKRL